jgi:hypothetical protein
MIVQLSQLQLLRAVMQTPAATTILETRSRYLITWSNHVAALQLRILIAPSRSEELC